MKIGDKDWCKLENSEQIAYSNELFEDSRQSRQNRDMEWYLNYSFLDGNHYVYYNTVNNTIERIPRRKGEVRIVVNKVKSMIRAVTNYATRFQPKWEVLPGDLDEETVKNAHRASKVMDFLHRTLHLEIMEAGIVESGLNTSVGWVELDWDPEAEGGLGQVKVLLQDSFDTYPDPRATIYAGEVKGRYIAKSIRKTVSEIKANKRYLEARKDVQRNDELSDSILKSRIMRKEGAPKDEKIERAIVREFQFYDDEKNEKGGHIQLFTYAGDVVLRDEPLKEEGFTLYCYQIPQDPKKIYHRSWTADIVPLNKALDRTVSQKVMYVNQALIYRILAEKGHGVNVINNDMGQVVEINPNRKWEQMNMHPLPSTLDTLENDLNMYIEDLGGAHEAALGRSPAGARSGDQIEALQAADSNNLSGIRMSLESFLSVIGSKILDIVSEKWVTSRVAKVAEPEEGQETDKNYLRVIGAGAPDNAKREGVTIINKDNEIIVKIGSYLGYTVDAQRTTILKMAELGLIPAEEVLKQFEFANVEELSAKARDQRMEKQQMDAQIAGRTGSTGGSSQGGNSDLVTLADKENMGMMQGQQIPPTEGADAAHTQAHVDFMRTAYFSKEADDTRRMIFKEHVQGELQMHMGATSGGTGAMGGQYGTPTEAVSDVDQMGMTS